MSTFRSIRTKLIYNTMIMISVIFLIVLSVITVINIVNVNKNITKSKKNIFNSLITKGKTLVTNNSLALTGMAEDNAFTAIQTLVSATVKDDDDMSYGIYMDNMNLPWVVATPENPDGMPESREPLNDSMSSWAAALKEPGYKSFHQGGDEIVEFAAPVISEDDVLGFIRYGISTKSMQESILDAQRTGRATRNQMIAILILLCIGSLTSGYFIIKRVAIRITNPIGSLVMSSKQIADGNYDISVKAESNDEIGNLAMHFESMRATIKRYTDHLQELIDEKMQQVNDILNNIDQGLFTINLDGTVNPEYSARANEILKVDNIADRKLHEILRLEGKQQEAFKTWLDLVRERHTTQRWKKLVKLAPVLELELIDKGKVNEKEFVSVSYQKIFDKKGNLAKIMVLAMDETEKRMKDLQMAEERQKHENEVKTILGIANTPPDEISEFMEDTAARLHELHLKTDECFDGVKQQREQYPNGPDYNISKEQIDELYRNMHTIKGNAGSYGFELLSYYAHQSENMLEELKEPIKMRRTDSLQAIRMYLGKMDEAITDIHQKIKLVFGNDEEISIRIPEYRVKKIQQLCSEYNQDRHPQLQTLIDECMMLSWKPLKTLARKYQKLVLKAARKLHKQVDFVIENEQMLFAPDELVDVDDVLIHIARNAVDHGIESPEIRDELGKGSGKIRLEYTRENGIRCIRIADDGRGIDTEKLVQTCLKEGILTSQEVMSLSEDEKRMLIFRSGVSTTETVTDISGRGMGMNIVQEKITRLSGSISIQSVLGKGTTFIITIPEKKSLKTEHDTLVTA